MSTERAKLPTPPAVVPEEPAITRILPLLDSLEQRQVFVRDLLLSQRNAEHRVVSAIPAEPLRQIP